MIVGVLIGSAARRRSRAGKQGLASLPPVATSLLILVIAATSFFISRPGRTEPILGPDGRELAGSIAEVGRVEVGGHQQTVIIRGQDATNPILLYLTGGPGNSDFGYTRTFLEPLEEDFVLVGWDQRGAGASYPALDPVSTLTLDSAVSDVIELSEYLTGRLDQDKIYVLGNSWGSIIGVLAVERRPDLFHAYIGSGQMVSPLETDAILNDQVKAHAERSGDEVLARKMELYGEPPYTDWQAYGTVLETYGDLEPYTETEEYARGVPGIQGTGTPEYGFMDKVNVFRGLVDMGSALYSQAQEIDLREDAPSLAVPVYFIQGSHEMTARSGLAEEYAAVVEAPRVTVEVFDNSGHVPHFEEAGRFHRFLIDVVLADDRG